VHAEAGGQRWSQATPGKSDLVLALLPRVFGWARAAGASQPLTSALWVAEDEPRRISFEL
jgi:hypothetical protein